MTTAITEREDGVTVDGRASVSAKVEFATAYPTGGEPIAATALGLNQIDEVHIDAVKTPAANIVRTLRADTATDPRQAKLLVYTAANTEAGEASDQTGLTAYATFVGS